MAPRAALLLVLALVLAPPAPAEAQLCRRGIPCGNSCIPADRACSAQPGTARAAPTGSPDGTQVDPRAPCLVAHVVDGDTLDCADGRRIRLLLIDAPEMDQGPFGEAARIFLLEIAPPGSRLRVETDVRPRDRYGRLLAYLHTAAGRSINEEMLRMGLAIVAVYPPNVRHVDAFRDAADRARAERRGLWAVDAFDCPPADHRAGRCDGGVRR